MSTIVRNGKIGIKGFPEDNNLVELELIIFLAF